MEQVMVAEGTKTQTREELNKAYFDSPLYLDNQRIIDSNMPAILERANQREQQEVVVSNGHHYGALPPDMRHDSGMDVGG